MVVKKTLGQFVPGFTVLGRVDTMCIEFLEYGEELGIAGIPVDGVAFP